ncbi:MAG: dihydropteroate synthase [Akkermansiaceae bacterium]
MLWKTRRRCLTLTDRAVMMGILNVTPDSFSDGGEHDGVSQALGRALEMEREGAEIIDIGGESTRPGAAAVAAKEEIARTVPVIRALREASDVLISIDTSKSEVAAEAIKAGADIVNDVTGLTADEQMLPLCVKTGVGVVVMHMQGTPETMQKNPNYDGAGGVTAEVEKFFAERLEVLTDAGMDADAVCFDPGIGFGKSLEHNLGLLGNLSRLQKKRPLLLGVSRKSFLGQLAPDGDPAKAHPAERDAATAEVTARAFQDGILLHRVHNVAANLAVLENG